MPKGRLAEDGRVPDKYPLQECGSAEYAVRTELNVRHSDATLILRRGPLSGGTQLTLGLCRKHRKPVCVAALGDGGIETAVRDFLAREKPAVLNVAGPRESSSPGIYKEALELLSRLFAAAKRGG